MKTTLIALLKTSLVGKKVKHKNANYREVILQVEDVTVAHHSRQITPDTRENDWWGASCEWDTVTLYFTDGSRKEFSLDATLEIE